MQEARGYNRAVDAPTDEQLLQDYLAGEPASFELLVRRHALELYRFAMRFTSSGVAAEDVVQETFLQVTTSAHQFDPKRSFRPWLFTIAANKARDYLRKRDRKREISLDSFIGSDDEQHRRFVDLLASNDPAPHADGFRPETHRLVRASVEALPTRLREVLVLAYYHRLPYQSISDTLGIPLGTVKSRLHASVTAFANLYRAAVDDSAECEP